MRSASCDLSSPDPARNRLFADAQSGAQTASFRSNVLTPPSGDAALLHESQRAVAVCRASTHVRRVGRWHWLQADEPDAA